MIGRSGVVERLVQEEWELEDRYVLFVDEQAEEVFRIARIFGTPSFALIRQRARLIASAPKLLRALFEIADGSCEHERNRPEEYYGGCSDVVEDRDLWCDRCVAYAAITEVFDNE